MPPCASEQCVRSPRWWRMRPRRGARLDGAWLCSQVCVEDVVRERLRGARPTAEIRSHKLGIRLGALLKYQKAVPPERIAEALEAQARSRLRLGEQLRVMGVLDAQALLRALAEQAGVSYLATVDPTRVHDAPGGLSLDAIQALRLVPLGPPSDGRIRVACPAPVPRTALGVFRRQTGWTPDVFLVGDDDWLTLLEHYGAGTRGHTTAGEVVMGFARERDAEEGVRRLAQVAMAAGESRLSDARWGPYVWARLQGAGAGFDLLIEDDAAAARAGGDSWQAVTTSR